MSNGHGKGLSKPTIRLQMINGRKSRETVTLRDSARGGFSDVQQIATTTDHNPPIKHFPPDRKGPPHTYKRPVVPRLRTYTGTTIRPDYS